MAQVLDPNKDWLDLPDQLLEVLTSTDGEDAIAFANPEIVVVFGRDTDGNPLQRSFASEGRLEFEGEHHPGELKLLVAELEMNSPLTCRWNGYRWVCH